jgi:hypothetical protein
MDTVEISWKRLGRQSVLTVELTSPPIIRHGSQWPWTMLSREAFKLSQTWAEDCSNKVLACAACNSFKNRYQPEKSIGAPETLAEFYALRDKVFAERKTLIAKARKEERSFFESRPWRAKKK